MPTQGTYNYSNILSRSALTVGDQQLLHIFTGHSAVHCSRVIIHDLKLEDVLHIFGLPIDGEVVTGWTDSSQDFLVNQSMAIFGSEPVISTYNWGSATLAHFYRAQCCASQYDYKEMDDTLDLLFVWAWERMPFLVPIPRQWLALADILTL
ncbi:hypothetical protein AHAS_Ahas18G0075600 [Arachis hypogaea]